MSLLTKLGKLVGIFFYKDFAPERGLKFVRLTTALFHGTRI